MRRILLAFSLLCATFGQAQEAVVLNLDTPIYSATAEYVHDGLQQAEKDKASCIILKINTPGGLLKSTRKIVGDIMQSDVPVVAFVGPSGARAGSAGAFITLSANLVAMAPGTNIGAAHPVTSQGKDIEGEMNEKVTNDAVAFKKSIAEQRGRDFSQLKEMVTNSRSFSAKEALKDGNIDFIVNDISGLLNKIDGQTINLPSEKTVVLNTAGSKTKSIVSGFRVNFLNFLSNPDVMYLLLLIGLIGVLFEIFNPGIFVAGIIGAFCLILSGYGMTLLPVNFAGLALIVLAMVLFLLEIKITSFGLLTLGGVVSLGSGAVFLVKAAPSFDVIGISWTVIIVSVILTALFFIFIIGLGLKAQLKKTGTGTELLKGKKGTVLKELSPKGQVRVNGEIWKAIAESENIPVETSVEVIEVNNFQLTVKPVSL